MENHSTVRNNVEKHSNLTPAAGSHGGGGGGHHGGGGGGRGWRGGGGYGYGYGWPYWGNLYPYPMTTIVDTGVAFKLKCAVTVPNAGVTLNKGTTVSGRYSGSTVILNYNGQEFTVAKSCVSEASGFSNATGMSSASVTTIEVPRPNALPATTGNWFTNMTTLNKVLLCGVVLVGGYFGLKYFKVIK